MADDVVVFQKADLPLTAFPAMEEIRRQGKLCDVTLRVSRPPGRGELDVGRGEMESEASKC